MINSRTFIETEHLSLMKGLEVHRVDVAAPIRLAGGPHAKGLTGISDGEQQWQGQVIS